MLSHQQMGHDAARVIGEYDSGMDSLSISQDEVRADWKLFDATDSAHETGFD